MTYLTLLLEKVHPMYSFYLPIKHQILIQYERLFLSLYISFPVIFKFIYVLGPQARNCNHFNFFGLVVLGSVVCN